VLAGIFCFEGVMKKTYEEDWEIAEDSTINVQSIYVTRAEDKGLFIHVPKELLGKIGMKEDGQIKMWVEGKRLVVEAA